MFRKIIIGALSLLAVIGIERFCHKETDGFRIDKIHTARASLASHPLIEQARVRKILNQPFTYLGKGAQCYVFESEDKNYVVKFFRAAESEPLRILSFLPFNFLKEKVAAKQEKRMRDFASYELAYTNLKEETGLIFLHLDTSSDLQKAILLVDKLNIKHKIASDRYAFALQKRADLVKTAVKGWMEKGEEKRAAGALASLVQLLSLRAKKGIYDADPNLSKNFGFVGERPIQIDCGGFSKTESRLPLHFVKGGELSYWLKDNYTALSSEFEERLKRLENEN